MADEKVVSNDTVTLVPQSPEAKRQLTFDFPALEIGVAEYRFAQPETDRPTRHTTLTMVVTNQKLEAAHLTQLARQVHSSLARAIQPFHTVYDGDTLFAMTTSEVENSRLTTAALGVLASELAWDAVLNCFED